VFIKYLFCSLQVKHTYNDIVTVARDRTLYCFQFIKCIDTNLFRFMQQKSPSGRLMLIV